MTTYNNFKEYIQSQSTLDAKILAIEALIDEMLLNTIDTIGDSGTMSYSLDDGQMKVLTQYRSAKEITAGVLSLEKLKNIYVGRRDGNITILRGGLNY
jgi:predicted signal transduction protein with EAL and GGDEF domain